MNPNHNHDNHIVNGWLAELAASARYRRRDSRRVRPVALLTSRAPLAPAGAPPVQLPGARQRRRERRGLLGRLTQPGSASA